MHFLTLVLPILWALVATLVGLLLYKTSKSLFDERVVGTRRTRRIRMTGSVAIAAVTYIGMWTATPGERLKQLPDDALILSAGEAREITVIAARIDNESLHLSACLATYSIPNPCQQRVADLRSATSSLIIRLREWKARTAEKP